MARSTSDDRLIGIELLRFASALAVLIFHYQHFAFAGTDMPGFVRSEQPFYGLLQIFYEYGFYGVQFFWCISGFIFYWKYSQRIAAGRTSGHEFFVLRFSRLYPLHLITLLFVAAAQLVYRHLNQSSFVYEHNDVYHFMLQLFLASNWDLEAGDSFNGPIWSVSIEVLVYLLFFLNMRLVGPSARGLLMVLLIAAVANGLKLITYPVVYCVLFFYVGCFTAVLYRRCVASARWNRGATAIALLLVCVMPFALQRGMLRPLQFLFICVPALVFLCVRYLRPTPAVGRYLAAAGNVTYASYLLHVPVQITVCIIYAALGQAVPWRQPVMFMVFLTGILLLSHACYHGFEMPMQDLLRKTLLRPRIGAPASIQARPSEASGD